MTEKGAADNSRARGVWRIAPGLWCDRSVPDMISVAPEVDAVRGVHSALKRAGQLPPLKR